MAERLPDQKDRETPQMLPLSLHDLQTACGADRLVDWEPPSEFRQMDYSGALITPINVRWADGSSETVLIKLIENSAFEGLSPEKAEKNRRSYRNEAFLLRNVCPDLDTAGIRVPRIHGAMHSRMPELN